MHWQAGTDICKSVRPIFLWDSWNLSNFLQISDHLVGHSKSVVQTYWIYFILMVISLCYLSPSAAIIKNNAEEQMDYNMTGLWLCQAVVTSSRTSYSSVQDFTLLLKQQGNKVFLIYGLSFSYNWHLTMILTMILTMTLTMTKWQNHKMTITMTLTMTSGIDIWHWNMKFDIWNLTSDIWNWLQHMVYDIWPMTLKSSLIYLSFKYR